MTADLHARARDTPDRATFLVDEHGSLTYGELRDRAGRLAGLLDAENVSATGRVVLMSAEPRHVAAVLTAVVGSGRTLAVVDPSARPRELHHAVGLVEPELIVVDRTAVESSGAAQCGVALLPLDAVARPTMASRLLGRRKSAGPADELTERLAGIEPVAVDSAGDAASIALIMFTSGSSAAPKGVLLSRRALSVHLESLRRALDHDATVIHNVLPLHHSDGLVQGPLQAWVNGGTWVRPGAFSVGALPEIVDAVYTHRVTHMITVPTILALLDRLGADFHDAFRTDDFRSIVSNAAPLGERLWRRIEDQFGVTVCNSYGLTETVTSSLLSGPTAETGRAVGTVGRPLDATISIVREDGAPAAHGEVGELVIEGDHLFSGYLGDPAATAAVFDGTRFRTGDLARRTDDGAFVIVGRASRMIITAGTNVAPDEVDDVVGAAPGVVESCTVGLDDAVWGERVVTAVTAGDPFDPAAVLSYCRGQLAPEKVPREVVRLEALPRTPAGKIDARAVAVTLAELDRVAVTGSSVDETVLELAATVLGVDVAALSLGSDIDATPGWDSLAHMELVAAVEEHWTIELSNTAVIGIRSLGDIVECVRDQLPT
ncbi:MAG: AMP-binding protein [Acidimicrobiales bacterium]|nr:AMP-binding protein [Acidimicrobiales bacterium]